MNQVMYSKKLHRFFSIQASSDDGAICSGFTTYYADALTNNRNQLLSFDFLADCVPVGPIDKFPFAEYCTIVDSWKVKGG